MFEKTQKAINELRSAVSLDVTSAIATTKAVVAPVVAEYLNKFANAAQTVASGVEDGSLFKPDANHQAKSNDGGTFADPLPTEEQNNVIKVLRKLGRTDEEIAKAVGVSVLTVKMSWNQD